MVNLDLKNVSGQHLALFVSTMRGGGAEKAMVNLARGLVNRGLRVDLILMEKDGPYLTLIPPEVRVIDLADSSQSVASVLPLRRYLRRERPAALIVALKHPCMVALLAKRLGIGDTRIVTTLHGNLWKDDKRYANRFGRRVMYPWADEITAVSAGVADDFSQFSWLPRERLKVIYNPIVSPELRQKASEAVDHKWFQQKEIPVILSVGRLSKEKDYGTLIRAFALVRKNMPAHLLILGEGPERKSMEALVAELGLQESIRIPGFIDNPYAYMSKAALFVLSSTSEGLPNVIIEALAVGAPVVSTDCKSGPREILDNGKYGTLVSVGDTKALAAAIEKQLATSHDKEFLMARADEFSIEKITDQFLEAAGLANATDAS